jgi:hypothetical protein
MLVNSGDILRVRVQPTSQETFEAVVETLNTDPSVKEWLAPLPATRDLSETNTFDHLNLLTEFVFTAGAQLTAEAVVALISTAVRGRRRRSRRVHVTATSTSAGVIDVTVAISEVENLDNDS